MLKFFSPAKINLFLRVVNRRPDGFHNLSSVIQAIDLCDIITFQPHCEDFFSCSDTRLPIDEQNLIVEALTLFRSRTNTHVPMKIHLEKVIPIEAGLGGGSSNAATTLWAMNQLSNKVASTEQLSEWGAEIGSDVPFFFSQGTAFCTGRGEKVNSLPSLPPKLIYIVKPKTGLSTPRVFKKLELPIKEVPGKLQLQDFSENDNDLQSFFSGNLHLFNDLEKPAFELDSDLCHLKQYLLGLGFHTVLLTGSGTAFFCLGEGARPQKKDLLVFSTKFMNRKLGSWYSRSNYE